MHCSHPVINSRGLVFVRTALFALLQWSIWFLNLQVACKMADDRKRVRESLLYEFRLGHSVDEAHQNLSNVYAENAPSERTC